MFSTQKYLLLSLLVGTADRSQAVKFHRRPVGIARDIFITGTFTMPKYRQLHLKLLDSFDFAEMPNDFTRVVWLLLILIVDSKGRGIYNHAWIRSKMFPLRPDVSLESIAQAFAWLAAKKMIVDYSVDGKNYFYIPTFPEYQSGLEREGKSVLPDPQLLTSNSGVTQDLLSHAVLNMNCIESVSEYVSEGVKAEDPFDAMKVLCERLTGRSSIPGDVSTINKFIEQGIIEADIANAIKWWTDTGKVITRIGQLENSVLYQKGQRIQTLTGGVNGGEKQNTMIGDGGVHV